MVSGWPTIKGGTNTHGSCSQYNGWHKLCTAVKFPFHCQWIWRPKETLDPQYKWPEPVTGKPELNSDLTNPGCWSHLLYEYPWVAVIGYQAVFQEVEKYHRYVVTQTDDTKICWPIRPAVSIHKVQDKGSREPYCQVDLSLEQFVWQR